MVTADGYLLRMERIPLPTSTDAVFMMHGGSDALIVPEVLAGIVVILWQQRCTFSATLLVCLCYMLIPAREHIILLCKPMYGPCVCLFC